jgi:hypothetical protein
MISNPKIGFKRYPGFSLLFDNTDDNHFPNARQAGKILKLNTAIDSGSESELYRRLRDGLAEVSLFTNDNPYSFFVLPPSTYHVTVWEGFNEGNKQLVFTSYHQEIFEFLEGLPLSLMFDNPFSRSIKASPLLQKRRDIQFEFKKLSIWGNVSLVAQLKPSNPSSETQFTEIEAHRSELYRSFEKEFGLTRWHLEFSPHITLGYFGNEEGAKKAHSQVQEWKDGLLKIASDVSIQFSSIGFYGFTDMVNFFRIG